jgi:Mn-dependent DtxR family transcriptional regulator
VADQSSFLRAIRDLTGNPVQQYVTIDAVAEHLGIGPDEAERTARRLDDAGMVRVGGGHSVTLTEAGRQLVKKR